VKPQIVPSMFPVAESLEPNTPQRPNTCKRRVEPVKPMRKRSNTTDGFGDDEINDDELVRVACDDLGFEHIENFANPVDAILHKTSAKNKLSSKVNNQTRSINASADHINREPVQLANGKWACNHPCKDKNACKHLCCKEGMDKPPKKPATTKRPTSKKDNLQPEQIVSSQKPKVTQSKLQLTTSKRKISSAIEELDLTREEKKKKTDFNNHGPKDYQGLHQLQNIIQKENPPSSLHSIMHTEPTYCYSQGGEHNLSFMQQPSAWRSADSSDYGDIPLDELLPQHHHPESINKQDDFIRMSDALYADEFMDYPATAPVASRESDTFGDDDSLLGDAMVGLADSQTLQALRDTRGDIMQPLEDALDKAYEAELHDDSFCTNLGHSVNDIDSCHMYKDANITSSVPIDRTPTQKPCILSNDSTVSSEERRRDFNTAKTMLKHEEMEELRQSKASLPTSRHEPSDKMAIDNYEALDVLDMFNDTSIAEEKPIPDAYEGLEPWLLQEFGAIVEIVDE
jgi:ATP-dependent DNA helicase HFM1/MER3